MAASSPESAFGGLLKRHRTAAGLTQEELAERAGLSTQAVSTLERGTRTQPRDYTVHQLADALGLQGTERETLAASARGRQQASEATVKRPLPTGNFLGALPAGPLIGRQDELQRMATTIERVREGAGQLVLLAGEPGVGKTRLAQEVMLTLQERGFLVATGSCYDYQQTVPYAPFLEVLTEAADSAPPVVRAVMEERWPYLGWLLPEQVRVRPAASTAREDEQQRLIRAVTGFLLALADVVPVGILLDDLHWADGASLTLLQHLARSTRGHPVFLLGTYRTAEVDRRHPLARALLELGRAGVVEQLALGPLSEGATALLAAETVDQELSEEVNRLIYARSEGNPFFVRHLLQALQERGGADEGERRWTREAIEELAVPESVREVIEQRLLRLNPFARTVLQQASVLGQVFAFDDLLTMGGHEEEQLEDALVEVEAAGLVQEREDDRYAFDHALTQCALYEQLATRRRRTLHRAAGEAIELGSGQKAQADGMGRAAELVWHFRAGGEEARALPYALLAGEQAQAVFAHEQTEHHYRVALHLAREVGDQGAEAQALERLGDVLETRAQYREAQQVLEQGVDLYRLLGDGEGECRVVTRVAMVHAHQGKPQEGFAILQSSLDAFEAAGPSRALIAAYVALAALYRGRAERALELAAAERAVELARLVGDDRLSAEATMTQGFALLHLGQPERGLQVLEDACRLAERTGDLVTICRALRWAADAFRDQAEFARSTQYTEAALEIAERLGEPTQIIDLIALRGLIAMYTGDWDRARAALQRALDMSREIGEAWRLVHTLTLLGEFCRRTGEWDEADRCLEEGLTLGEQGKYGLQVRWAQFHLAYLDLLQGHPTAAHARLLPLLEGLSEEDSGFSAIVACLARVHVELGNAATALELAERGLAVARAGGIRLALVEGLLIQGMILVRQGETGKAEPILAETLALARSMPYPYVEAEVLREYGLLYAQQGEPAKARNRLEEALTIFRRLGARWDSTRTEQALAALGC